MEAQHQDTTILEEFEINLVRASHGKRLANYVIDFIAFYLLLFAIIFSTSVFYPSLDAEINDPIGTLAYRILVFAGYALFMFLQEAVFKGKSIGKFITGTRAVKLNGNQISGKELLVRNFSRAVPFDNFSALGSPANPWHDKWADTMVIDEKRSEM